MKNMVDVVDNLIMNHKEIPVYVKNLYKWTSEPSVLKQDICWDISILKDSKCPYCDDFGDDLYEDKDIFIYVDPKGYLIIGDSERMRKIKIVFCPMCGKQLK